MPVVTGNQDLEVKPLSPCCILRFKVLAWLQQDWAEMLHDDIQFSGAKCSQGVGLFRLQPAQHRLWSRVEHHSAVTAESNKGSLVTAVAPTSGQHWGVINILFKCVPPKSKLYHFSKVLLSEFEVQNSSSLFKNYNSISN